MNKYIKHKREMRNLVMLPNGKQPLHAHKPWKPSDGYIEPSNKASFIRALVVMALLVAAGFLTLVSSW